MEGRRPDTRVRRTPAAQESPQYQLLGAARVELPGGTPVLQRDDVIAPAAPEKRPIGMRMMHTITTFTTSGRSVRARQLQQQQQQGWPGQGEIGPPAHIGHTFPH